MKNLKILLCSHLFLWIFAIFFLLPTNDDWGYLAAPQINGFSYNSFLPNELFWRPVDAFVGLTTTHFPVLFPFLNHLLLACGLILSSYFLYKILILLGIKGETITVSIGIFLVSPATLGTILGIDSINQMYSVCFGMLSIMLYLRNRKNMLWILAAIFSVFSKENGIVYFIIPPIIGYINDKKTKANLKMGGYGIIFIMIYFVLRIGLQSSSIKIDEDSPYAFTIVKKITDLVSFIVGTTSVVDFISLIHKPSRNVFIVAITLLISILFLGQLFWRVKNKIKDKNILLLLLCMCIAASPHLATHFGPMHAYSTLPFFCMIVAKLLNGNNILTSHIFRTSFYLFIITAIAVDWHHWYKTYQSSQVGPIMAREVLSKTEGEPNNVLCIVVKDDYPRFSSFCVPPRDVFCGGEAVRMETGWTYPKHIKKVNIVTTKDIESTIQEYNGKQYDCVWVTNKQNVKVINN